jgi:hypothetical protein
MLQLDPQLSVVVKTKNSMEWIKGYAFMCIDYSQEHDLMFVVSIDKTGEIWIVPTDEVRMESNWSLKRRIK